jgi:hypothetical protein
MRIIALGFVVCAAAIVATDEPPPAKPTDLPPSVRITREAGAASLTPSDRKFIVRCCVVSETLTFSLPDVTVRDGEHVTMTDTSNTSRVVAHKIEDGRRVPIVRETTEGTIAEFTVIGVDAEQAVVDVSVALQGPPSKLEKPLQGKRFSGLKGQLVDCLKLGETATCPLDATTRFEVTVRAK